MMDTTGGGEMILGIDVGHHLHGGAIGMNHPIGGGRTRGIGVMIEEGEGHPPAFFRCRKWLRLGPTCNRACTYRLLVCRVN